MSTPRVGKLTSLRLSDIKNKRRARKDYGDIASLAASIADIGLLHPLVVDSSNTLIVGGRRLKAVKQLKWETVPVLAIKSLDDAHAAMQAESQENTCRKALLPSEAVELGKKLERLEKPKAKERKKAGGLQGHKGGRGRKKTLGEKNPMGLRGPRARDKVGESVGMSGRTYEKAKEVVESGDEAAIKQMDRTGKVGPAYNRVKQKDKQRELEQKAKEVAHLNEQPEWTLICGDSVEMLRSLDEHGLARLVIADPPYNIGVDYGSGKKADLISASKYIDFTRSWIAGAFDNLTDDGSLWIIISDEYAAEVCMEAKHIGFHLRSWIKWFEGFGVNCSNNFNRTTRHVFWFVVDPKNFVFHSTTVMRKSDRQTKYKDKRANSAGKIENDLWDIPRLTGTCNERLPQFPTQLPLAITTRIVLCASDPGDLVIDPFNGSGTTGVSALSHRRKYIGIDNSEKFIDLSTNRIRVEVKQ